MLWNGRAWRLLVAVFSQVLLLPGVLGDCSNPTSDFNCGKVLNPHLSFNWTIGDVGGVQSLDGLLTYEGDGWVSWGHSEDGNMMGGVAVVGVPGSGVWVYEMKGRSTQDVVPTDALALSSSSIITDDGVTYVSFTRPLVWGDGRDLDATAYQQHLFAYGGGFVADDHTAVSLTQHTAYGHIKLSLSGGSDATNFDDHVDDHGLTVVQIHGLLMVLAWLLFSPMAMLVARYGRRWKHWLTAHMLGALTALALATAGIAVAIGKVHEEHNAYEPHFSTSHSRMGLAAFVALVLQIFSGILRPRVHKSPATEVNNTENASVTPVGGKAHWTIRQYWLLQHRILPVTGLILAVIATDWGMNLHPMDNKQSWQGALVAWGIILAVIIIGLEGTRRFTSAHTSSNEIEKSQQERRPQAVVSDTNDTSLLNSDESGANSDDIEIQEIRPAAKQSSKREVKAPPKVKEPKPKEVRYSARTLHSNPLEG